MSAEVDMLTSQSQPILSCSTISLRPPLASAGKCKRGASLLHFTSSLKCFSLINTSLLNRKLQTYTVLNSSIVKHHHWSFTETVLRSRSHCVLTGPSSVAGSVSPTFPRLLQAPGRDLRQISANRKGKSQSLW